MPPRRRLAATPIIPRSRRGQPPTTNTVPIRSRNRRPANNSQTSYYTTCRRNKPITDFRLSGRGVPYRTCNPCANTVRNIRTRAREVRI